MGYKKVISTIGLMLFMGTGSAYADKVPVEFMQWSEFKNLIPITRDITVENSVVVEDVETGALFRVISTAGVYHADIESLTAEDAAVRASLFKKGSWKRPVLIHVKGKVIAASIYGEPHCGLDNVPVGAKGHDLSGDRYGVNDENLDAVKGNNEDGVMCIHVRGCINHFNQKTDTTSQSNIDSIMGKYPDGVEYKGNATTSSGNLGTTDTTTTGGDNPETTVGNLLSSSSDDFITGKLIGGTKKLDTVKGTKRNIVNGAPPTGSYYFSDDGYLVGPAKGNGADTSSLKGSGNLFNSILQGKERAVVKEMQDLQKDKYKTTVISGDLNGTQNFWTYDLQKLYSNSFASNFTISDGKTEYTIYVPRGKDEEGNQINGAIIGSTIRSIEAYKYAVMEGFYGGMVVTSYNLFSMYPTVQLPMTDVVDITKIDKNNVRPLKSTTRMKYALDYYYHPILGKISAEDIPEKEAGWREQFDTISLELNDGGKLGFTLDEDYYDFLNGTDPLSKGVVQMKDAILSKSNGMRGLHIKHTNDKAEPASVVGTLFRVAIPKTFEKSLDSNKYIIKEESGYNVLEDVRLSITHAMVYVGEESDLKVAGDYVNYGIEEKGLAFYKTVVNGKTVGAVIPLWYNEAVYDPYDDKLYYTGRPIRFDNDYVNKIEFTKPNIELLTAVEKAGGNRKITIREFAFGNDKDYLNYEDHENIGNLPDSFDLNITFEGHKVGKPNENHSVNGGAEADVVGDGVSDDSDNTPTTDGSSGETVALSSYGRVITHNYGIPSLMSVVYADNDSESVFDNAYYDDIVVTDDYDPVYGVYEGEDYLDTRTDGPRNFLEAINPFSRLRSRVDPNIKDANTDWGHGVTVEELKKITKGKLVGKEEALIQIGNVYKVNPAFATAIILTESGGNISKNNPGNIKRNGKIHTFGTLEEGLAAMYGLLSRKYISSDTYGRDVHTIGNTYCPPSDNKRWYKDATWGYREKGDSSNVIDKNAGYIQNCHPINQTTPWSRNVSYYFHKATGEHLTSSNIGQGIVNVSDNLDISALPTFNASTASGNGGSNTSNNTSTNVDGSIPTANTVNEVFNGFTIMRNNVYLQDEALLNYLGSNEARSLTNVEADELTAKIMGESSMANGMLTYKEWDKMQGIRDELDNENSLRTNLLRWTRILTMIFGFGLIFYSILLIFAYYIDIFNGLLDISLLSMMTFGRYYPIANKEEISYLGSPSDGQKYVTIFQLFWIVFWGVLVGGLFVLATPILEFIALVYIKIKSVIGGI